MEGSLEDVVLTLIGVRKEAVTFIIKEYRRARLRKILRFNAFVLKLLAFRATAGTVIQKAVRGFLVRRRLMPLKKWKRMIIWNSPATSVRVVGNFTEPQWGIEIELQKLRGVNLFYTDFMYQQKLPPGKYTIKFVVDGVWTFSKSHLIKLDAEGNANNIYKYKAWHKIPRSSISAGALPEMEILDQIKKPMKIETESLPPRSLTGSMDSPTSLLSEAAFRGTSIMSLNIVMKEYMAAHPVSKSHPLSSEGSADAFFIDNDLQMFGLADGVGEWERHGLDPSLFATELMQRCHKLANEYKEDIVLLPFEETGKLLKKILTKAYSETKAWGSSTALLCIVKDAKLVLTALGDSSVLVLRQSKFNRDRLCKYYKSKEQQHFFNCPYQLSHVPTTKDFPELIQQGYSKLVNYLKQILSSGLEQPTDSPEEQALEAVIDLQDGDIIIAATDGLFDNLFDTDIKLIGEKELKVPNTDAEFCRRFARNLVTQAVEKAFDTRYISPFAKAAKKAKNYFIGGKLDDVTVVVARAFEY